MSSTDLMITAVTPAAGVPGGEVRIECRGFRPGLPDEAAVYFGDVRADIVSASSTRVVARIPDSHEAPGISLENGGDASPVFPFLLGTRLASEIHAVANPVLGPDGSVVTTVSGSREEQTPQPVLSISRAGVVTPFPCEILNPTGLAYGPDGHLYLSSRADGTVVRVVGSGLLEVVAEDLGVPCGIAFDAEGDLYVGDRTGRILRLDLDGGRELFAALPPSVAAFHLAFAPDGALCVTGPTLSMRDPVYRIPSAGKVEVLIDGFARPQGLAFGPEGDLWIAASHSGKKGIFRFSFADERLEHAIAGPTLVGIAFGGGDIYLVDHRSLYRIQPGWVSGRLS